MKILISVTGTFLFMLIFWSAGNAADCTGGWKTIPEHDRTNRAPCEILGLDTHKGTCQPGQQYETLCDDASDWRYRTCQGPKPCRALRSSSKDCKNWDFDYDQPCPRGYINTDCQGSCDSVSTKPPCKHWDFNYNQLCPDGFVNFDCAGGCEPVRRSQR